MISRIYFFLISVVCTVTALVSVSTFHVESAIDKDIIELISNGSFELRNNDGFPKGFNNVSDVKSEAFVDDTVVRTGSYSFRVGVKDRGRNGLGHHIAIKGGMTYRFSVWYRAPEMLSGHLKRSIQARLQLSIDGEHPGWERDWIEYPPPDASYEISIGGSMNHLLYVRPAPETKQDRSDVEDWDELTFTFTLPSDINGNFIINLYNDGGNGVVWFDDLSVVQLSGDMEVADLTSKPEDTDRSDVRPAVDRGVEDVKSWRSQLYPEDWTPCYADASGRFIQDFSFAGYHAGMRAIPHDMVSPVVDVTNPPYMADPSGRKDATEAIQLAIDNVGKRGGGTVYLPPGRYVLNVADDRSYALGIPYDNVHLIGAGPDKTYLQLESTKMRAKSVIRVFGHGNWGSSSGSSQMISEPLTYPTQIIPLNGSPRFDVGDWVVMSHDTTKEWISDHNMSDLWPAGTLPGAMMYRKVIAVDTDENTMTVDAPIRYYLLPRDNARVYKVGPHVEEVGIGEFSIGMKEHPGIGWGGKDFGVPGTAAYDVHASHAITFVHAVNSWVRNINSYKPEGNSRAHTLSNGILVSQSRFITIDTVDLREPQYLGEGGNGYHFTLTGNDTLITNSVAYNGRHNYDFKQARSIGNVIHNSYAYSPDSLNSDFHMHLSPSNLIDGVVIEQDRFDAGWRGMSGTVPHGLTTTQTVFWNTFGKQYKEPYNEIVYSEQYGWGYIIGTQGPAHDVSLARDRRTVIGPQGPEEMVTVNERTLPVDYVEGIGQGDRLMPQSLYSDQLQRRVERNDVIHCPGLDFRPPVARISIDNPSSNATVHGNMNVNVRVDPPLDTVEIEEITVSLGHKIMFSGHEMPTDLEVDTRVFQDGAYEILVKSISDNGLSAQQSVPFFIKNHWKLDDHLDAPIESGWFGVIPQHKTAEMSDGWTYDVSDADLFFGDRSRIVREKPTEEYLVWDAPALQNYAVTIYTDMKGVADDVILSVWNGHDWTHLGFSTELSDTSSSGLIKAVLTGDVSTDAHYDRFRLIIRANEEFDGIVQIGEVTLEGLNL